MKLVTLMALASVPANAQLNMMPQREDLELKERVVSPLAKLGGARKDHVYPWTVLEGVVASTGAKAAAADVCEDHSDVKKYTGYTCKRINAMYAPACEEYLCPKCEYAHYCDSTCGFCTGKVTTEKSTSESQRKAQKDKDEGTSAYGAMAAADICEDSQLVAKTMGYTCGQINAMYAPACKEYLCPECEYAHYCDSTCGFCTDASATETIHALDTVTETKEISENKPYFGMPVAEPSPSQQTSPHPGTMADEHTQQSHPSEPAEGAREMPNKEGLGIDTRLATEIPKAPESDTGYGTQMEHVADEPVQEHERDEKSEMPPRSDGGSTLERPVQEIKLYDEKTEMPPRSDGGSTLERPVQGLEQDVKPGMALWPRSDGGSSLERPVQELEQNGEKTEPPPRSDEGRSEEPRALVKTSDYSDPEWASLWESLSFKRLKRSLRGF